MYCQNCGKEIPNEAVVCVHCGVSVAKNKNTSNEPASTVLKIVCFCLPIVGLILYLVYMDNCPIKAKECGKFALIGFVVGLICTLLLYASRLSTMYY